MLVRGQVVSFSRALVSLCGIRSFPNFPCKASSARPKKKPALPTGGMGFVTQGHATNLCFAIDLLDLEVKPRKQPSRFTRAETVWR